MKSVFKLSDIELEDCIDGSTSVDMIREILEQPGIVNRSIGFIDVDKFATAFAEAIEGFINEDEDSDDWQEAWDNNLQWGNDIAHSINSYLKEF